MRQSEQLQLCMITCCANKLWVRWWEVTTRLGPGPILGDGATSQQWHRLSGHNHNNTCTGEARGSTEPPWVPGTVRKLTESTTQLPGSLKQSALLKSGVQVSQWRIWVSEKELCCKVAGSFGWICEAKKKKSFCWKWFCKTQQHPDNSKILQWSDQLS